MKQEKIRFLLILAITLIFSVLLLFNGFTFSHSDENPSSTHTTDFIAAGYLSEIDFYNQQLESKDLSDADRRSLQAKLAYAQRQATQRAQFLKEIEIELTSGIRETEIVKLTLFPYPTAITTPQRVTGIMQAPNITIPQERYTMNYKIMSLWIGSYQEWYIFVYSGALFSDLDQGVLTVQCENPFTFNEILAPDRSGPLKIIAEKNLVLTLETENKEILYFDVLNQRFVNSPEDALQPLELTPTPLPAHP